MGIETFTEKSALRSVFGETHSATYRALKSIADGAPDDGILLIGSALLSQVVLQATLNTIPVQRAVLDELLLADAAAAVRKFVIETITENSAAVDGAIKVSDSLRSLKNIEELQLWQLKYILAGTVNDNQQVLPNCLPAFIQEIASLVNRLAEDLPRRRPSASKHSHNRELELDQEPAQTPDDGNDAGGEGGGRTQKGRTGKR